MIFFKSMKKNQQLSLKKKVLKVEFFRCVHPSPLRRSLFCCCCHLCGGCSRFYPALPPGDDERTTRVRSPARGRRTKINRSSQTKGHLLARDDNLSSRHKGEDGDKSLGVVRRRRRTPDSADDSSLSASGLR